MLDERDRAEHFLSLEVCKPDANTVDHGRLGWTTIKASLSPEVPRLWLQQRKDPHSLGALSLTAIILLVPLYASPRTHMVWDQSCWEGFHSTLYSAARGSLELAGRSGE